MAARQPVLHASLKVYAYMYISLCYLYKKKKTLGEFCSRGLCHLKMSMSNPFSVAWECIGTSVNPL